MDGMQGGSGRLMVEVHVRPGESSTLAEDVRRGLSATPKTLPPKHLYEGIGSELFDRICDTPEYYPTRTERALLDARVDDILDAAGSPDTLVELGSGAARKTRLLLEGVLGRHGAATYVPVDVSESMLTASAERLLDAYPKLRVHGVVADYDRHLDRLPRLGRRLVAFLGGTLGNFEQDAAVRFLGTIGRGLGADDRFLIGMDLVKDVATLEAAYDDAAGWTAKFNLNVLTVINEHLGGHFDLDTFTHVARYDEERAQIEMHLRSHVAQTVRIDALEMDVELAEGETIHTEISRKFTESSARALFTDAGLAIERWWTPDNGWFALALARNTRRA